MHLSETSAFLNQKGGVGKTTSVANVGAGLTILGKKVLLVDLDPQGHLSDFLGIRADDIDRTVYDVLRGEAHPLEAVVRRKLSARMCIGDQVTELYLSVIPAGPDLAQAENYFSRRPGAESSLKGAMSRIAREYDHIIFDCPPNMGFLTLNALVASSKVFIPVQCEFLALKSLEGLLVRIESVIENLELDLMIGGLIATRYDGRKVLGRSVVQAMRERYGILLLETIIRENIALAESPRLGKDIFSYRPRSYGAADYLNLSLEIMGRIADAEALFSVERGVIKSSPDSPVAV
jgi:chromosome partitioning protein